MKGGLGGSSANALTAGSGIAKSIQSQIFVRDDDEEEVLDVKHKEIDSSKDVFWEVATYTLPEDLQGQFHLRPGALVVLG